MDAGYCPVDGKEERPGASGYTPSPGQSVHDPPSKHELSRKAPGVQTRTGVRREVAFGPKRGPHEPVQPGPLTTHVVRELTEILQERENLRKDRGVYLQKMQYLAKEQLYFQQELREHHLGVTLDPDDPQRCAMTEFLQHINTHLLSLRKADESTKYHLLRLQQEAVLLGLPPPDHPWSSDADILLPDEEDESQQQEIVPLSCAPLQHPSPPEPPHHDTPRPQASPPEPPHHDTPRPQASPPEPPHHDTPRPQPLTATVRPLPSSHVGIVKSAKKMIELTKEPMISQPAEGASSTPSSNADTHSVSAGDKCMAAWSQDGRKERIEEQGEYKMQQEQQEHLNSKFSCTSLTIQVDGEKKTILLPEFPHRTATLGLSNNKNKEEGNEIRKVYARNKWRPIGGAEPSPQAANTTEVVSAKHSEGTVLRVPPKENTPVSNLAVHDNKDLHLGSLKTFVRGVEKKLSFSADDVLTKATMLVGDKVQFKISTNLKTKEERAVNVEILADTFQCTDTEELRRTGVVLGLSHSFGYIKCSKGPELVFDLCEVMEDEMLSISEKVEFTIVLNTAAGTGYQAIRIRRSKGFTSVPTLEGSTTTQTQKGFTSVPTLDGPTIRQTQRVFTPVPTLDGPTTTQTQKGFTSVPTLEGPTTTQAQKMFTFMPTLDSSTITQTEKMWMALPNYTLSGGQSYLNQLTNQYTSSNDYSWNGIVRKQVMQNDARTHSDYPIKVKPQAYLTLQHLLGSVSCNRSRSHSRSRSRSRDRGVDWYWRHSRSCSRSYSRSRSSSSRSRSRSWDRGGRTGRYQSHRSSSREWRRRGRSRERGSRDRWSRSRSRELSHRNRRSSSREKSRELSPRNRRSSSRKRSKEHSHRNKRSSSKKRSRELSHRNRRSSSRKRSREVSHRNRRSSSRKRSKEHSHRNRRSSSREGSRELSPRNRRSSSREGSRELSPRNRRGSTRERSRGLSPRNRHSSSRKRSKEHSHRNRRGSSRQGSRELSPRNRRGSTRERSRGLSPRNRRSSSRKRSRELSPRNRRSSSRKRSRELSPRNRRGSTREGSRGLSPRNRRSSSRKRSKDGNRDGGRDQNRSSNQGRNRSPECKDEKRKRQSSSVEGSSRKSKRTRRPKIETVTAKIPKDLSSSKASVTTTYRSPKSDEGEDLARKEMELEELEALIAKKLAENDALELQMTSTVFDPINKTDLSPEPSLADRETTVVPENSLADRETTVETENSLENTVVLEPSLTDKEVTVLPSQTPLSPQHHRTTPPLREADRDELYDPFQVDEEEEGEIIEGPRADWRGDDGALRNGRDISCGGDMESGLRVEELAPRQAEVDKGESCGHGDEADDCYEHHMEQDKSLVPYDQKRENQTPILAQHQQDQTLVAHNQKRKVQTPSLNQHEQEITDTYRQVNSKTHPKSTGITLNTCNANQLSVTNPTTAKPMPSQPEHSSGQQHSQASSSDTVTDVANHPQPPHGQVTCEIVKTVWICGDGLVAVASQLAQSPLHGIRLGQSGTGVRVYWKGLQGMLWDQLVPLLRYLKMGWPSPDMLIIHLGHSDVDRRDMEDLLSTIRKDLTSIHNIFPQCLIVWSDMLPRYGMYSNKGIIDLINVKVHAFVAELGGTAITHQIGPLLYGPDGMFLSQIGIHKFNLDIKVSVDQWEQEVNQTSGNVTIPTEKVKTIWICGDSLVALGNRQLESPQWGMDMGSPTMRVYWSGTEGMKWKQLVPHLINLEKKWPLPDMLLIHLGGDSIRIPVRPHNQQIILKNNLTAVHKMFPQSLMVWSDIIRRVPRKLRVSAGEEVEDSPVVRPHDVINRLAHAVVTELGGQVLTHENMEPGLFRRKGQLLSDQGVQKFSLNIRRFLDQWEKEVNAASEHSAPTPTFQSPANIPAVSELTAPTPTFQSPANIPAVSELTAPTPMFQSPANIPADDDIDVTPEDSGNTVISFQQSQKQIRESNESPVEVNRTHGSSEPITGLVTSDSVKRVWICGDSLVALASRTGDPMAQLSKNGTTVNTYWKGYIPSWYKLVPKLKQVKLSLPNPDMLIIHLQIREMSPKSTEELLITIKRSLTAIRDIFPQCLIVWSDFLQEPLKKKGNVGNVDNVVDGFYDVINRRVRAMIAELGGTAISHDNIRPKHYNPNLCHRNGKRLECGGVKIFKNNINDFIFEWEWKVNPTSEPVSCSTTKQQQVRESNESPVEVNQTHGSSEPITGGATSKLVKTVWICGDSLVATVSKKTPLPTYSSKLRFYWSGEQVQKWKMLLPQLSTLQQNWPPPDVLIIHMKDDFIHTRDFEDMLSVIRRDLTSIRNTFPQCLIVWSDILPRYSKKQGAKPVEMLNTHHGVINGRAHGIVAKLGGAFVTHKNIGIDLYRRKGSSLTCNGVKVFKTNIQDFVNEWAMEATPASKNPHPSYSTKKQQQVRESNESPVEVNQTHGSSEPITVPATVKCPPKTVWMCGDALSDLARWMTTEPPHGVKTSSNSTQVFQVTTWSALVVEMTSENRRKWRRPDLLLVHLGVNNNVTNPKHLLNTIRKDLTRLHSDYPQCLIVWSNMLPVSVPKAGMRPVAAGRINKVINRGALTIVTELGGRVLSHENIGHELYGPDGNFLSDQGTERLKLNFRQFLQEWEQEGHEQKPA
ncbi:uncharacterized protein LOC143124662 isoform X4 [Alosa pseudoharengus]|uniref:uncharacterized protein LOC143124662 isoform X4 n=1 Tax=Alosa pseudoharengus TaxID=34774 RepID=UPI003F8C94A3